MGTSPNNLFRKLLPVLPRGSPLGTAWLLDHGLTAKQAARLADDGWLNRLSRGVYLLPGDTLDRDACIAWLSAAVPGCHVAGKTALAWRGVRHNIPSREPLTLWGDRPCALPAWFTSEFDARYQAIHLFDNDMPPELGLAPLPAGRSDVMVSTPERAVLELLSDVGKRQSMEEAGHLIESFRSPRLQVFEALLSHLTRIKVVRLAYQFADEFDLPWKALARHHSERLGGGKRWVSVGKTGDRLNLKRPT